MHRLRPARWQIALVTVGLAASACGTRPAGAASEHAGRPPAAAAPAAPRRAGLTVLTHDRRSRRPTASAVRGPVAPAGRAGGRTISLSFDDGPWPAATPGVLALLARYRAPAVFCVIGRLAVAHPDLVRREVALGNQLCDHSRDHDLHAGRQPVAYQQGEVTDGLRQVEAAAGGHAPVRFYRQPGGLWDPTVVRQAWASHLTALRWTDDPRDWQRPSTNQIIDRVLRKLAPGGVILLHDGGGDRSHTLQALAWLLPHLRARGWHFVLPSAQELPLSVAAAPQ